MACTGPSLAPVVEAHRAAAGYWPGNSRAAVEGSIAAGFEAIEVDLVLTRDAKAVLSHDPFLDPGRCATADGQPLADRVRIDGERLRRLQGRYLCGGLPDPDHPQAEVLAEPLLSLAELLELLEGAPAAMRIHLDLKIEPGWTPPAEDWLEPVLERWWEAELPQELVISANRADSLRPFEDHARAQGRDLTTWLIFPLAPVDADPTAVGLQTERDRLLGRLDYVDRIEEAGADGIAVNWEIAERGQLLSARRAGYQTALWTVNTGPQLAAYARWPVDALITDYPGAGP